MTTFSIDLLDQSDRLPNIGLVVLQEDETLESEMRRYFSPTVADLYVSRVPSGRKVTQDSLAEIAGGVKRATTLFPHSIAFDAVGYCCTSGAAVTGVEKIGSLVRSGCFATHVTEPLSALIHACRQSNVRRLAYLSPYIESVNEVLRATLFEAGIETPAFGSFDESEEAIVARIDPDCTKMAAIELARSADVDAVFLSCTNLKTFDILAEISNATGLPTISSNSALAQHLGTLAGVDLAASK
ncbi:MAG: maleate cis-trans isomerase family protein [Hyphomicrobiaceae bacterium]